MELTHLNKDGFNMVDISGKKENLREAEAEGFIKLGSALIQKIQNDGIIKGDVVKAAQIAGIQAAKKTSSIIPLCHNINLTKVDVNIDVLKEDIRVRCLVKTVSATGVEMECLTGAAAALLTVYDMCKSSSKNLEIYGIKLVFKRGGKSGEFVNTLACAREN